MLCRVGEAGGSWSKEEFDAGHGRVNWLMGAAIGSCLRYLI